METDAETLEELREIYGTPGDISLTRLLVVIKERALAVESKRIEFFCADAQQYLDETKKFEQFTNEAFSNHLPLVRRLIAEAEEEEKRKAEERRLAEAKRLAEEEEKRKAEVKRLEEAANAEARAKVADAKKIADKKVAELKAKMGEALAKKKAADSEKKKEEDELIALKNRLEETEDRVKESKKRSDHAGKELMEVRLEEQKWMTKTQELGQYESTPAEQRQKIIDDAAKVQKEAGEAPKSKVSICTLTACVSVDRHDD